MKVWVVRCVCRETPGYDLEYISSVHATEEGARAAAALLYAWQVLGVEQIEVY